MPNQLRERGKINFYGPLPPGLYILAVIDCYSRFPEIEILITISALKIIPKLDGIFARHGIPLQKHPTTVHLFKVMNSGDT